MTRKCASLFCLLLVSAACSQQRQNHNDCVLRGAREIQGTAFLVTGVESEGRLKLSVFKDKCSESLANVYFAPNVLSDIAFDLASMPGREFDDVKVAILDAKLSDAYESVSRRAAEPILVDYVYGVQPLDQQNKAGQSQIQ